MPLRLCSLKGTDATAFLSMQAAEMWRFVKKPGCKRNAFQNIDEQDGYGGSSNADEGPRRQTDPLAGV